MPIEGELTQPDDSLRSELEAAFTDTGGGDGSSGDGGISGADSGSGSPAAAPLADATASGGDIPAADSRARGPDGKFIEKQAAPEKVAAADPNLPSTDAAKASEVAAQTVASAPPAGWTAAEKAEWSKLSPVAQAAVSRREAEIANGGRQWSEEKRRYEAAIAPVAMLARSKGLSTEEGIQRLARAQQLLDENAAEGIRQIAASYGVNLATLAGHQPDEVSNAQNPDIEALVRQAVQRSVAPIVAPIQQRWQQEEQRQNDMTMQAIHSFASAPGHEHYPAVEATIALILPQVIEENPSWTNEQKLQEAYDRALYATPSTRQQVMAAKESQAAEQRRQEAATRATKARGAAVSVTGAPQGSAAPESAGSLREEIVRAMTG